MANSKMRAIILNAGKGKRMMPLTKDTHKCLLEISGKTILEHQLINLQEVGVSETIIVTGAFSEKICDFVKSLKLRMKVVTIFNPFYEITENIVSFWFARDFLKGKVFIMMGDLLFDKHILVNLMNKNPYCGLAVHQKDYYEQDDMKVKIKDGKVKQISKNTRNPNGESLQISFYNKYGSSRLKEIIDRIIKQGRFYGWYPEAVQELINEDAEVLPIYFEDHMWIEIDSLEELKHARRFTKNG
jgi:choline kinase